MSILAKTRVFSKRDGFRQPYSNFSNRQYDLPQHRGTILMGIAVWRVTGKPKITTLVRNIVRHVRNSPERSEHFWILGTLFGHNTAAAEPEHGNDSNHVQAPSKSKS